MFMFTSRFLTQKTFQCQEDLQMDESFAEAFFFSVKLFLRGKQASISG